MGNEDSTNQQRQIRIGGNQALDRAFDLDADRFNVASIPSVGDVGIPGGTATPQYAAIAASSSGDNTIVAAITAKKILVLQLFLIAAGSTTVRFEDGAGGTALTGQLDLTTNSGMVVPFSPIGWFQTSTGTLLNMELSNAISVAGAIVYVGV